MRFFLVHTNIFMQLKKINKIIKHTFFINRASQFNTILQQNRITNFTCNRTNTRTRTNRSSQKFITRNINIQIRNKVLIYRKGRKSRIINIKIYNIRSPFFNNKKIQILVSTYQTQQSSNLSN